MGRKASDDSSEVVAGPQSHSSRFVAKANLLGAPPGAAAGGLPKTDWAPGAAAGAFSFL